MSRTNRNSDYPAAPARRGAPDVLGRWTSLLGAFASGLAAHTAGIALTIVLIMLGIPTVLAFVAEVLSLPWVAQLLGYRQLRWDVTHTSPGRERRNLTKETTALAHYALTGRHSDAACLRAGAPKPRR